MPARLVRDDQGRVVDNATTRPVFGATLRAFNVAANPDGDASTLVPNDFSFLTNTINQRHLPP